MAKFEFNGKKYKLFSKHQKEWGSKLVSELALQGSESILDLGCGDGVLTEQLSRLVPNAKVVGLDASEGMLNEAKKLHRNNLVFVRKDINQIDYENEFDIIFSNATLHWIKNHKRLLSHCHRALKPNGIIRFNFASNGNCSNFFAVIKETIATTKFQGYFDSFEWPWYMPQIKDYIKLTEASNFTDIRVWEENADRYFNTAQEMTGWIEQPSIVPFLSYIHNNSDRKAFHDIIVQKMLQRTRQENGTYFETFRRINVSAKKS